MKLRFFGFMLVSAILITQFQNCASVPVERAIEVVETAPVQRHPVIFSNFKGTAHPQKGGDMKLLVPNAIHGNAAYIWYRELNGDREQLGTTQQPILEFRGVENEDKGLYFVEIFKPDGEMVGYAEGQLEF